MLRNEFKYVLTEGQAALLASRIRGLLEPDPHMTDPDGYIVSSLYFDDAHDSSYYEKLAGAEHRKKYRVRVYGGDTGVIMLERKEKLGSKIEKHSARISRETLDGLTRGEFSVLADEDSPLACEVLAAARARRLSPKVVVTYLREAYIHPLSATRITFDKRLDAGWTPERFTPERFTPERFTPERFTPERFTPERFASQRLAPQNLMPDGWAYAFPVSGMNCPGAVILEIKYNEYMPRFVAEALSHSGPPLAASKYVLCRDKLSLLNKYYRQ